jgi:predicted DNA-binding transcriptional regulator YafY
MIKKINKIIRTLRDKRYYIVYRTQSGKIKTYQIGQIDLYDSFGNKNDSRDNVGFRAYCFGRGEVRSFRHDRIISLTKK